VFSFLGNTLILSLATRCSGDVLSFSVAYAMDFNIPAFRHCLPSVVRQWSFTSRCLAMDVLSVTIFSHPVSLHPRQRFAFKKHVRRHVKYFFSFPCQVSQSPFCQRAVVTETQLYNHYTEYETICCSLHQDAESCCVTV
jgi:hypothetical protein